MVQAPEEFNEVLPSEDFFIYFNLPYPKIKSKALIEDKKSSEKFPSDFILPRVFKNDRLTNFF